MTVSRTLRDPEKVAPATREKVRIAIEELNYIPDLAAGTLSSRKSTMIAVVLPSLFFEGHSHTINVMSRRLRDAGFHVLLGDNDYTGKEEQELIRIILGRRPAAVVVVNSVHSPEGRDMLGRSGVPVVEAWHLPDVPLDCVVGFSHYEVGLALTRLLLDQGHERIGFIGCRLDGDLRGRDRHDAFQQAMEEHGLSSERVVLLDGTAADIHIGRDGIVALRERFPDTSAVLCLSDRIAMGVLMECRRRGIAVPEELAVVGHGNFDFGEYLEPSLTTSSFDAEAIGEAIAMVLLKRINGETVGKDEAFVDVGFTIIERDSTRQADDA